MRGDLIFALISFCIGSGLQMSGYTSPLAATLFFGIAGVLALHWSMPYLRKAWREVRMHKLRVPWERRNAPKPTQGVTGVIVRSTTRIGPTADIPPGRQFTNKTVGELLGFYLEHNGLQADKLIAPEKGLWIETEGSIMLLLPDGSDGAAVAQIRDHPGDMIECRFGPEWGTTLARYKKVDWLRVRGKIAQWQNGSQLYLVECEPVPPAVAEVDEQAVLAGQVFS